MEETILKASDRSRGRGKFREKGYIAGVIYGDKVESANTVKFESADLLQVLRSHGRNARVTISYNNQNTQGFIKEIQKDPISQQITHVDVQVVSKDQEVKLQVPLVFKGEEELAARQLQLVVYKSEVTILGTMDAVPESITVDVSQLNSGDSITAENFGSDPNLKISEKEDAVFAAISHLQVEAAEDVTEGKTENE